MTASGWRDRADRTARGFDRILQIAGDDVRLDDGQQVLFVDLEDAIQPLHRDHHSAADRHRAAGIPVPAPRTTSGTRCSLHRARDRGDLGRGAWMQDEIGGMADLKRVDAVLGERLRVGQRVRGPDDGLNESRRCCTARDRSIGAGVSRAGRTRRRAPRDRRSHELLDPRHTLAQPVERGRVRNAEEPGRVKPLAGGHRHVRLFEQRFGKLRRRPHAAAARARQQRKETSRTPRAA